MGRRRLYFEWPERDEVAEWLKEDFNITIEDAYKLFEVYNFLEEELGETVDNGQIGFDTTQKSQLLMTTAMFQQCTENVSDYLESFFWNCDYNTDVFLREVMLEVQGRESELE